MKGRKLLKEFLKEKDNSRKRREGICKFSSLFKFFQGDNRKLFEEMMDWAFNKGEDSGREMGYSQCSYDNTGERSCV